jgi:signal transduction histidine kinase
MAGAEQYPFLLGGGEMGERTRNLDWPKTTLGSPDKWPLPLRMAVSILLNSQFPMFVWWGSQLITIYNDAYRSVAGDKHPALLGRPGNEAWIEIWPDLEPLVVDVFNGNATWSEDLLLNIKRSDRVEETYFTFSYSPILNEDGSVGGLFCSCIETTEKVFSKRKLEESEKNLRNTILQAPVAMFLFKGENLVIDTANEMALQMIRRSPDVVGKPLLEVIPELAGTPAYEIIFSVYNTGNPQYGTDVLVPLERNGVLEDRFFNFAYTPLLEDGRVIGVMDVANEVTAQVAARHRIEEIVAQRTAELAAANKELQRSNEHLEEFAYAASHDLKEPVRKVQIFADRLRSALHGRLENEDERILERLEYASKRMSSLIDDLLLYSHVSQRPMQKEPVDLHQQITKLLDDLEIDRDETDAEIVVHSLPVVMGYERQLQQLFHNLLTNALKYRKPEEPPKIQISATRAKGGDGLLHGDFHVITVSDNGIGFEKDESKRIFQMFQRLHGQFEYEGTGVGLSIAEKVANNHGGQILAEGEPGKGASFHVYLPLS